MNYFELIKRHKLIKGLQADYSPKYFFVWENKIYLKMRTPTAMKKGFQYRFVDFLDLREYQ